MGSRFPYHPIIEHTRRLDKTKWQGVAFVLARVQYRLVGGYLYPEPLLHIDYNAPTNPEYSWDIPGRRSFHIGWSVQIIYPIRFVCGTLPRRYPRRPSGLQLTFGFLRGPSGASRDLRPIPRTFGCFTGPSADSADLRVLHGTFGFLSPSDCL